MSAFPDTYGSFLKVSRTPLAQARRRRERVASMLVRIGAAVVLAALLVIPAFLAYGGWAGKLHGDAPTWAVTAAAAAVGFTYHLASSLGDLVADNKSGARTLPLRLALRIGAPRLLLVTIALGAASVAGLVVAVLTAGLRQ